jgi:hypothetical protein
MRPAVAGLIPLDFGPAPDVEDEHREVRANGPSDDRGDDGQEAGR